METEKILSIEIPDGYEIDKERSTFERIVFKKIEVYLPESWLEFSTRLTEKCVIVRDTHSQELVMTGLDRWDAEAHYALLKLHHLRDCYRQGWDETMSGGMGWVVYVDYRNNLDRIGCSYGRGFLSFQNKELADEFAKNFKDLILQAKKLLR